MVFWKIDKLVTQLKYDTLSENQKVMYLIALFFLMLPNLVIRIQDLYHLDYSFLIEIVLDCLIMVFGIYSCFKVNESGDNVRFVERFVCLSFPLYFRLIIIAFLFTRSSRDIPGRLGKPAVTITTSASLIIE